jgi:hypothetical protein
MNTESLDCKPWPTPTLRVYTSSGKFVGYATNNEIDAHEVYLPGGDDEGFEGAIVGNAILFGNGEVEGRIDGDKVLYSTGAIAGVIRGNEVYTPEGIHVAHTEGLAPTAVIGGSVLLLILNRWFLADGTVNPSVR